MVDQWSVRSSSSFQVFFQNAFEKIVFEVRSGVLRVFHLLLTSCRSFERNLSYSLIAPWSPMARITAPLTIWWSDVCRPSAIHWATPQTRAASAALPTPSQWRRRSPARSRQAIILAITLSSPVRRDICTIIAKIQNTLKPESCRSGSSGYFKKSKMLFWTFWNEIEQYLL